MDELREQLQKDGVVTLTATNGTPYTNVRVEAAQLSGPATATVYAYDESGKKFDLSESGAWGPTSGFAVGGTFTNDTKISIIYPEAGTYVSRLSLIDLSNNNSRSVQSLSPNSATPWIATHQASLSITNSQSLLKLMSM